MLRRLARWLDDLLFIAGCLCILYGLSLWNMIITWLVAGVMLIVFGVMIGVMIGKAEAKNAVE